MNTLTVLRSLAATASRIEKEKIVSDAYLAGNREFFVGARLAYDKLVSFGVAKAAEIAPDDLSPNDPGVFTFSDFINLTNKLRKRELTGHAARDAINDAASKCHGPTWNEFYRRVILKDMKIGCSEGTINKCLKKIAKHLPDALNDIIPVFECMLAKDGEDPDHQKKIKGKKFLDLKLDGVRTLSVLDKEMNKVLLFTRNGQQIETFPEVRANLEKVLAAIPGSVVLEGELMSPQGFQHLMTLLKNPDRDTSMVRLALFDIVPLQDFQVGLCKVPLWERHENLSLLETSGTLRDAGGKVYVLEKKIVDLDTPEGKLAFDEFNREAIEAEIEGIMIKDPESPYEAKRSASWLKKKPFVTFDLTVTAVEEGKADGKYVGMMGAVVCSGYDQGKFIETDVGSGFSDAERVELWSKRNELIGQIIEIKGDAITTTVDNTGKDIYSIRFPRFMRVRSLPGEIGTKY